MSNNAHVNDDELEIHQLPEVSTLQAGMMVAVDSQPTGTKSFNLTNALAGKASASDFTALENTVAEKANTSDMTTALEGKVDAPATTPEEGQVLTFDGSANTWANPPEGVYVLNYTEVTDIRDVDIEKAKTMPTFLKIDTEQPLTISVPQSSGSPYTVNVQPGTIMGLEEIGSNGTSGSYSGPKFLIFGSKFGEEVGGGIMQNADLRVICCIALSAFGGVSKGLTVTGNMDPGGNLFGNITVGTQPFPITTTFFAGKGPGNPNTNRTQNALGVDFQSAGKIRRQVLMPEDIQSNLFYSNSTPEIIQFMGWGATSNRAGYKTSLLATHSTRSSEYPPQTPSVAFNRYVMGSSETSDNVATSVRVEMISSVSGQGSAMFGGNLVPNLGSVGALQYWSDNNGVHYGFKPVNEVPASTSAESGKVLKVGSNGTPSWGNEVFIATYNVTPFADILAAKNNGALVFLDVSGTGSGPIMSLFTISDSGAYFTTITPGTTSDPSDSLTVEVSTNGTTDTWSSIIVNNCAQLSSTTIETDSSPVMITGLNNGFGTMSLNRSSFTLIVEVNDGEVINFALEIENSQSCQLTIQKKVGNTITTLKHSVAAGNTLEANKTYQVTAVGTCWTLAEFEA